MKNMKKKYKKLSMNSPHTLKKTKSQEDINNLKNNELGCFECLEKAGYLSLVS
jgi:hypothetical protein